LGTTLKLVSPTPVSIIFNEASLVVNDQVVRFFFL